MSELPFNPHPVAWSPEKIGRLWSYQTSLGGQDSYFSQVCGSSILRFVRRRVPLEGRQVLDFGCGPGYLIEHLLRAGSWCAGVEFSADSVAAVNQKFATNPRFRGAFQIEGAQHLDFPSSSQDVVFLVEVIEHILEDELAATLESIHRLLVPGGHVAVTTPNAERLADRTVLCPDCGAIYHQWQHVRSFDHVTLSQLMSSAGFAPVVCTPALFGDFSAIDRLKMGVRRAVGRLSRPHLIYIGVRT